MLVIVGAGLAGLSAAQKLVEANQRDFIIVEAQDYIGGRIKTTRLRDGTRLDLGAQWLHGEKANPIYEWLETRNLIEEPEEEEIEFVGLFRTQQGKQAPMEVVAAVLDCAIEAKRMYYNMSSSQMANQPGSHFLKQALIQGAKMCCSQDITQEHKEIVWATERWFELYEAIDNSCENLEDLSLRAYTEWTDCDEGKLVKLRGGWQSVIDHMIESIGSDKILLNSPVDRVEYSQKSAQVTLANGRVIDCDHVLITIPIGPLKRLLVKKDSFIKPDLTRSMNSMIEHIGFGPVAKIFLQFERPFLQEEEGLKLLWTDHHNPAVDLPRWTRDITGFDVLPGSPSVLLAWVGCRGAFEVEKSSDSETGDTCLKVLKTFLPDMQIPRLISVTKSDWSANQHIGGAYSYPSIRGDNDDTRNLWDPICIQDGSEITPRVLFAGEATAGKMYATAHGAIVSGWREADRLIKLMPQQT